MISTKALRRIPVRRMAIAGVALAAAGALTLAAAGPAGAGIPDANSVDYLRAPMWTNLVVNPTGPGYWVQVDAAAGHGAGFGTTLTVGGATGVGTFQSGGGYIAATPSGQGLFFVDETGAISKAGDAENATSAGWSQVSKLTSWTMNPGPAQGFMNPISGIAVTPSGRGLWVLDSEGYVYTVGDAVSHGQPGTDIGNASAVDIAATPDGNGYTILANDGGVFTYGDAGYYGRPGKADWAKNEDAITGLAPTADGKGYWILQGNGTITAFGDALQMQNAPSPSSSPHLWTDIAADPRGGGFYVVSWDGTVIPYITTCDSPWQGGTVESTTASTLTLGCAGFTGLGASSPITAITVTSAPPNGTLSGVDLTAEGASIVYTSAYDYGGWDSFTFTATSANGLVSAPYTLSFMVFDPDDDDATPPAPTADPTQIIAAEPTATTPVTSTADATLLAATGSGTGSTIALALLLLLVGGAAVVLTRRKV